MKQVLLATVIVVILVVAIWYEVASWHECLSHDSWWYCLRILSK